MERGQGGEVHIQPFNKTHLSPADFRRGAQMEFWIGICLYNVFYAPPCGEQPGRPGDGKLVSRGTWRCGRNNANPTTNTLYSPPTLLPPYSLPGYKQPNQPKPAHPKHINS